MYDGKLNKEERQVGQDSFVSCEARQSEVMSSLPVCKGSQEWREKDRQTKLEVQGLQ